MGGPTSSYATAGIALWVTESQKPPPPPPLQGGDTFGGTKKKQWSSLSSFLLACCNLCHLFGGLPLTAFLCGSNKALALVVWNVSFDLCAVATLCSIFIGILLWVLFEGSL